MLSSLPDEDALSPDFKSKEPVSPKDIRQVLLKLLQRSTARWFVL